MCSKSEWFDRIYTLYAEKLYKFAVRFAGDPYKAEDFVQDTFLTMLIKADELQSHENIFAWLLVTLRNKIGNDIKRSRVDREAIALLGEQRPTYDEIQLPLEIILPSGMRRKDKDILIMFYEKRLSYEEISERLNCSIDSCGIRLYRAREACKKLLLAESSKNFEKKRKVLVSKGNKQMEEV